MNIKHTTHRSLLGALSLVLLAGCSAGEAGSNLGAPAETNEATQTRTPGTDGSRLGAHVTSARTLLERADVAFEGEVVAIDYRKSETGAGLEPLAHTFVTYRVTSPIKHAQSGEEITLRFLGGPNGDGTVSEVSTNPRFDVGDQDILFVRNNGRSATPLVGGRSGRLRVLDGRIYSDDGASLELDSRDELRAGDLVAHPALETHTVDGAVMRLKRTTTRPVLARAQAIKAMLARDAVARLASDGREVRGSARDFSVDADQPFVIRAH